MIKLGSSDKMSRDEFAAFVSKIRPDLRLEFSDPGSSAQEHWRIVCGNRVYFEYWPNSKYRTIYCKLTNQTHHGKPFNFFVSLVQNVRKWESKHREKKAAPEIKPAFEIPCPNCSKIMILRRDGKFSHGKWYTCPDYPQCDGSHSAHPDGSPMGTAANRATRLWRHRAHARFDSLWKNKPIGRNACYRWLAFHMKLETGKCHIGSFSVEQCMLVIEICSDKEKISSLYAGHFTGNRV